MSRLFIITGPSGVGKSTIANIVLKRMPGIHRLVTYTTRRRRAGERDGREYYFISEQRFRAMRKRHEFFEWANVYDHSYGNRRRDLARALRTQRSVLITLDIKGAKAVRSHMKDATMIFLVPERFAHLKRHIVARGSTVYTDIARRVRAARRELKEKKHADFVVTNLEKESKKTAWEVMHIIRELTKQGISA